MRHSMLIMSCVCSYNVQGELARQLDAAIRDMVLRELTLHLTHFNNSQGLAAFGLSTLTSAVVADEITRYDATTQAAMRDECVSQLNPEQRVVYDNVMAIINRPAFFIDGLGGTGKTFFYSCLLSTVRAQGQVVIMASSGITALLLDEGRTTHSRFKIPVQGLNNTSTCYISRDSELEGNPWLRHSSHPERSVKLYCLHDHVTTPLCKQHYECTHQHVHLHEHPLTHL